MVFYILTDAHRIARFMPFYLRLFSLSINASLAAAPSVAQDHASGNALAVFLDCDPCDFSYIRREITFVNYVRDRTDAQVHVLVTTERAGAGMNMLGAACQEFELVRCHGLEYLDFFETVLDGANDFHGFLSVTCLGRGRLCFRSDLWRRAPQ
jgi:hypothetical protein